MAISADTPEVLRELSTRVDVSYPLLSDAERTVIRAYGVEDAENEIAWPALFVIAKDGTITHRLMLDSYKERPTMKTVLEALDAGTPAPPTK